MSAGSSKAVGGAPGGSKAFGMLQRKDVFAITSCKSMTRFTASGIGVRVAQHAGRCAPEVSIRHSSAFERLSALFHCKADASLVVES